jgi:hypothetical protein
MQTIETIPWNETSKDLTAFVYRRVKNKSLAKDIVNLLFQNEKFLKDFESVKKEWAAKAKEDFK